jgi:hypothetical protein
MEVRSQWKRHDGAQHEARVFSRPVQRREDIVMQDSNDQARVDRLIADFFAEFDNREGRVPALEKMLELFAAKAIVARHQYGGPIELATPEEFAAPRIALLKSADLVGFHEWETSAQTQILGSLAVRNTRYAKEGIHHRNPYSGAGTKYFQLAKLGSAWKIVALSWIDDPTA